MTSLVCSVDSTMWPVMAARMPISAVVWSRISPTSTMSGSCAGRAQHALEGEIDLLVHLHLVDAGQPVFDRVFDGDDLLFGGVEFVQRGVERRRLAATRSGR
jgi:hypothetical protein